MVAILKNISVILLIVISLPLKAQFDISIRLHVPQPNQLNQHDAWNFEVINNMQISAIEANINIKTTIEQLEYGDIYEAETDIFIAPQGVSTYTYNLAQLRNISIALEDKAMKDFYVRHKNLPDGNYRICVELTLYDPSGNVLMLSTDCIFHTIAHPGIILLNYPIDGDTLSSSFFQFMWIHSTYKFDFIITNYELILTEVLKHQTPEEALMTNPPILTKKHIFYPYYEYPTFERSLDTGKTYSWQVSAYGNFNTTSRNSNGGQIFPEETKNDRLLLATSNIEHFVIHEQHPAKKDQPVRKKTANYYIDLDISKPTGLTYIENNVHVSVNNPYGARNLSYTIVNERNKQIGERIIPVKKGKNKLNIDLTELELTSKQFYRMDLKLSDKEKYSIQLYKR